MATPRKVMLSKASCAVPGSTASPKKVPRTSRSVKAGLVFPVGHVRALLRRGQSAARVGSSAATYLTAVLEYITTELLEVAGNEQLGTSENDEGNISSNVAAASAAPAKKSRKATGRIGSRTLTLAVAGDEDLAALLRNVMMSGGGFVPKQFTP